MTQPDVSRVLVCGGREYVDWDHVCHVLDNLRPGFIIQGGAQGADALAKIWARHRMVPCAQVDAYWDQLGKAAGVTRNQWMLLLQPTLVLAFPGGRGTAHMKAIASNAGVKVWDA